MGSMEEKAVERKGEPGGGGGAPYGVEGWRWWLYNGGGGGG